MLGWLFLPSGVSVFSGGMVLQSGPGFHCPAAGDSGCSMAANKTIKIS
jgi:hypothetical protein